MTSVLRLAICAAVLAVSSAWASPYSIESIETSGTTFATGASAAATFERMRITQGGLIGISNSSPIAKLDVNGTISASDAIQVGASTLTCASSISGSIRWGNASNTLQICTGTGWVSLSSGTATASTAGATKQVQYNNNGALGADANFTYTSATGLVSASIISTTYVHIQSATNVLACGSALTGTMRFTSGTVQVCDGTNWGNVGIGVPTGTIMAFEASSCPTGWSEYTAGRGRFLRGIDNGAGLDSAGTRAAGNLQDDATAKNGLSATTTATVNSVSMQPNTGGAHDLSRGPGGGTVTLSSTDTETRPYNVAVTFCRYDGYQSGAFTYSSATVASTSGDVQFNTNNALAADSGNFTYLSSVLKAPTVSATVHNGQYASFTTVYNPGSFSGNTIAANSVSATLVSPRIFPPPPSRSERAAPAPPASPAR